VEFFVAETWKLLDPDFETVGHKRAGLHLPSSWLLTPGHLRSCLKGAPFERDWCVGEGSEGEGGRSRTRGRVLMLML
jgi:hypothetical protein